MSLTVYLVGPEQQITDTCPHCKQPYTTTERQIYYEHDITHNLNKMAMEAGDDYYKMLWRPEELDINTANQLTSELKTLLEIITQQPQRFKRLNPTNGWGTYQDFVSFVATYLRATQKFPDAYVIAER